MPRGGARLGAGRPKGQGKFGEKTVPLRVPESMVSSIVGFIEKKGYRLPLYTSLVSAGFPSPAEDHIEERLDLNEHLVQHPSATFFVRVTGSSMINAGIHHGDILIVDRSLEAKPGKVVIASIHGELTVKRFKIINQRYYLYPENPDFEPMEMLPEEEITIWGVVTNVIHNV